MKFLGFIGICAYWLAWPAYKLYFRFGERTRVVVVHGAAVLCMQQWVGNGRWSLPGGGLHRTEQPLAGALREVYEETGLRLTPDDLRYLGKQQYRQHGQHFGYHVFVCAVDELPVLRRQWYEVAVLTWLPAATLTTQTASMDTLQSIQLVRERTRLLQ